MIKKQFESVNIDDELSYIVIDGVQCYVDTGDDVIIVNKLNELTDEIEQLKLQLQNTSAQRDEFHRGARENANHIGELAKELSALVDENEQLKSEYEVLHTQYQDLMKFVENNFNDYLTREKLNRQIIKLSDENEQLKEGFEITIEKAFDKYMDSPKAEEVMDYIQEEFYKIIG